MSVSLPDIPISDTPSAEDTPVSEEKEATEPPESDGQQEIEESPVSVETPQVVEPPIHDESHGEEPPTVYRIPGLIIKEIGIESVIVSGAIRAEFIEFIIKTDGNLGGLLVFILANSASPVQTIYDFPAAEVKKDDLLDLFNNFSLLNNFL